MKFSNSENPVFPDSIFFLNKKSSDRLYISAAFHPNSFPKQMTIFLINLEDDTPYFESIPS